MAKQSGKPGGNKSIVEISASVAQLQSNLKDIVDVIKKLSKEGKTGTEIYAAQNVEIEKQLKALEKELSMIKKVKEGIDKKLQSNTLDSKSRDAYTKSLNKLVSLENKLGSSRMKMASALAEELEAQKRREDEILESKKAQNAQDEEAARRASVLGEVQNRLKQEGLDINAKEKSDQQQLRDQIKEGNARRTEEVKAFEKRRADFAKRRKARLKEIGQLEKAQERDRLAAAKTQLEIDLKMLNRGKMTLEQRRDAQAKLIRGFRANYDQQSNDYKKLTLRLIKLDESFEKQIADRDRKREKGSKDYAKNEEKRQKDLNNARRKVFKAEIDLANITAEKKIDAVNKYYNSELRNLEILGKKNTKEYKELYAEQLRLLKKYNRQKEAEDKKAAKTGTGPGSKKEGGFLAGLRSGFKGSEIGKAVGRLTGIGSIVAVVRKSFQALSKAITGSFKAAVNFEAQLAQLQAVTGISNKELRTLEKSVLDVAGSTKFTSEEIVQLQTELGKLGFSVEEIESATIGVARTAQALGEQVGPVAQRIGQILNQFNLDASETTRVADSLVSVINSSALSFEGFSTALQYIGPLGAEVGTTFEETSVAMALLADNGFTASRVGTGLRGILTELSTTGKDLFTVVDELADKEVTLAEAVDLVGKRNAAQLITLVEASKRQKEVGKSLDDLADKYFNQGSAAIAASQQIDTFQGNMDLLRSAVNRLQISFGNLLKSSKLLKIALKFIDEDGYNAAVAAEAIANADPVKLSQGLREAADEVSVLRKELADVEEVDKAAKEAAEKVFQSAIIAPLKEEIRLSKEKEESLQAQKDSLIENEIIAARARGDEKRANDLERLANYNERLEQATSGYELQSLNKERVGLAEVKKEIDAKQLEIQKQISKEQETQRKNQSILNERAENGYDAQVGAIQELIKQGALQDALEDVRNEVLKERGDILEKLQDRRTNEVKTLKQANQLNLEAGQQAAIVQGKINEMLAEQEKRKADGNEMTGDELLLFNAKLEQYKLENKALAGLVFRSGELKDLAQKEFELEFGRISNAITAKRQELEESKSILDVEIKTQEQLAKKALTEKEREAAATRAAELQIKRSELEKQAFVELSELTDEYYEKLFSIEEGADSLANAIKAAGIDDRFLQKAEERFKAIKLGFKDLDIDITDLANATGILAITLANTFKEKLSKGIALNDQDKAVVDQSLATLIEGMGFAKGTSEFDDMFAKLKPLLMSYLIPDPDSEVVEKRKKLLDQILGKLGDAIKEYNQTALQNTQSRLDRELESIRNRYKVEGDIIKAQLDNQLITESQFRAKQRELRLSQIAEENDIQKKKFDAQKQSDIFNVAVETAEALASNIIKNFKSFDTITATGLTAAGNLVILGSGAAKADAIRRRKFFPAKFEQGGMVQGPSHSEGGVPFTVQGKGGYEMEGGEFIINKKAASLHRGLLEKINNSYRVPTASSNYKFASGGMVKGQADESVDYLKAIAEATTSTAIQSSKPVRAFISSKDLRSNETERRLRDRNDRI